MNNARWISRFVTLAMATALTFMLTPFADAAPQEPIGSEAFRIVSPDWLAKRTNQSDVKILDVRTNVSDYQYGHVPGAVFLANDALRVPSAGVPVQYLDPPQMTYVFQRAGINSNDQVIVYADAADVLGATMVAYTLHRIGHENVAILDGGIQAYRDRHPLTQAYPDVSRGDVSPRFNPSVRVTLEELREEMKGNTFLLDTRPPSDYFGNTSRWMRNGHISGAVNLDWHHLMDSSNPHKFKSIDEMRRLIEATGVKKDDDVIVYCGTSREATLVYHVMKHLLGYDNVRLYEGSWTEYCAHTEMPVARKGRTYGPSSLAQNMPITSSLEPYQCGSVARVHTYNGILLASQPSPEDFEQAKKSCIKTVINLSHPSETEDFNESRVVDSLGMNYYNPAWNGPDELTDDVLDRSIELLNTVERPAMLHCSSANRTGAVWLAYSVLERGLQWDEALQEARTVGLRTPEYAPILKDYVQRRK